jgi:hypothetical protein
MFQPRGISLSQLPSSTAPPAPSVTGFSPTVTAQANGIAGDVPLSGTITNFPTDGSCAEMKFYARTYSVAGTGAWHHKLTVRASGLPQPTISQTISEVIHGLPIGENIDVAVTFDGFNGEGPPTVIISNYAMPTSAAILQLLTSAPTPGSSTPTPNNGNGTIGICTASGVGLANRLWIYDSVAGWQPALSSD